jgi:hypothetical protein
MEIEIKVKLDTEKETDIELIEDIIFQLQDIRDLLEVKQQNTTRTKRKQTNK